MTPERWRGIKTIFDAALELPSAGRTAFVEASCEGDAEALAEVQSLLAANDEAGDFIEVAPWPPPDKEYSTGFSIGPYRIVQVIGEGGMGMVYQAVRVDDLYRKLVAVKVARRGFNDSAAMRRFETERHILAHLEHPNIARLLDGGTTVAGQPFFVMDFIAGTPIDEYCDAHHLDLASRLRLFLTVCSAVQYAHQNFVVHRDIKPQNILVTEESAIRLLDFGIAKLLDPEDDAAGATTSIVQMMTPEFASPEQLLNEPVTTASDTYSLGVLLYILLTGHRPFLFKSRMPREIWDTIREAEPRRPSSVVVLSERTATGRDITLPIVANARAIRPGRLARELAGDLDTILLMALRREPHRRYTSVEPLANDIERYLSGQPVLAREDTFSYRAGKFVGRHKGAVAAAGLAVLALAGGVVATSWEARIATRERERAERRFNDVRRVANSLLFDVHDAIKNLPGATPARQLILTRALEFLDNLSKDAGDDRSLQQELAAAYERVGDVQGQAREANLGEPEAALVSYKKALAIREALVAASPGDRDARRDLVPNYGKLSDLLMAGGDSAGAMEYSRRLLQTAEALAAVPEAGLADEIRLATSYLDFGYKLGLVSGDLPNGVANCRKALRLFDQLVQA
jgi:serine/threonine protein kinase